MNQSKRSGLKVGDEILRNASKQTGLIILGNSGVGKSFLANVLIGHEAFVHRFSPNSITRKTEWVQAQIDHVSFTVFNVPGLIEAEQERIDLNKVELEKAFLERPNSVIIFVFGHQHGRIREEDLVAFNAINAAYSFRPESLAIIINGLLSDRPDTYGRNSTRFPSAFIKDLVISDSNICFLDQINVNDLTEMSILKEKLVQVVKRCKPMVHEKREEIETRLDQLKQAQKKIREDQMNFEVERGKFLEEIATKRDRIRETFYRAQEEKECFRRTFEQQQKNLAEQVHQIEKDRESFRLHLDQMKMQLDQAKEAYERVRQNPASPPQAVRRARSTFDELRRVFTSLIFKGFSRIINI